MAVIVPASRNHHNHGGPCDLCDEILEALKTLVSCVERDRRGKGILLPTEAALQRAKDFLIEP